MEVAGVSRKIVRQISRSTPDAGEELVRAAERLGQRALVPVDADYPAALRAIPDPPVVLYVQGRTELFDEPAVAIVGSRDHSRYGREVADQIARQVVRAGGVVVSGLARGLDAVAQAAALDAGGSSIGVLGTGVDIPYPSRNRALHAQLAETGLLVSEYPPGSQPTQGAFPRRNRIISGLSSALIVVEAANRSGTLGTVACALEQGREVLAVPGPITSRISEGTNRLIADGATPINSIADLPSLLGLAIEGIAQPAAKAIPCNLSAEEARVFGALGNEPRQTDELTLALGLPVGNLLGVLLGLELGGLAEQLPGGMFRRRG